MAFIPALATAAATAYSAWRSHKDRKDAMKHGGGAGSQRYEEYMPEQKKMLKDMAKHSYVHLPNITKDPNYQAGSAYLQKIISQDPELMKQFEAPAMRQFNEQVVPGIAERFAGTNGMGSSAFRQSLSQAGASLSERLAAMRAQLGMEASKQLYGYSQLPGNQRQQEQALTMQQRSLILGAHPYTYAMYGQQDNGGQDFMRGLGENLPNIWSKIGGSGGGGGYTASDVGKVRSISDSWGYNNLGGY